MGSYSLLQVASGLGRTAAVQYLIAQGLGPGGVDWRDAVRGFTALHCAMEGAHVECIEVLLDAGANVSAKAANGQVPMDLFPASSPHRSAIETAVRDAKGEATGGPPPAADPPAAPRGPPAYADIGSEDDFRDWFRAMPLDKQRGRVLTWAEMPLEQISRNHPHMPTTAIAQIEQVGKLQRVLNQFKAVVELKLDKDFQRDLGDLDEMKAIVE